MTDDGKLGVGVVGLGLVAAEHIRAYQANSRCEIVALCSRDVQRAAATAKQLGLARCRAYDDLDAGTSFANVVMEHPGGASPSDTVYNWDCHAVNCHVFNDARWRFPPFDQAVSALIEDVYARGLDRKVMVVVTGEFGHTPRISYQKGTGTGVMQPGRDHWPGAMSILVSGGGLRMGQVVGSTDRLGERPQDRPLSPDDLWATVYRHLGIDTEQTFLDRSGRPMPILPDGGPIRELGKDKVSATVLK